MNAQAKHTPSPWVVGNFGASKFEIIGGGKKVAVVERYEDAAVMALAPDLLDALTRIAEGRVMKPQVEWSPMHTVIAYQELARALIEKIEAATPTAQLAATN